ncbi:hypothetical protein EVAR_45383_1 [Eumeta japonica]|uniref:Uncharacterized protein n=1 Tax=Eumeta variegata TaxID=151549 RepID=A0A4C1WRN7_EUMVA|nr:hypothetical protein EVAR_45383_1 [Eumeta japonica]
MVGQLGGGAQHHNPSGMFGDHARRPREKIEPLWFGEHLPRAKEGFTSRQIVRPSPIYVTYNFQGAAILPCPPPWYVKDETRSGRPVTDKRYPISKEVEQDQHISSYNIAEELGIDNKSVSIRLKKTGYTKNRGSDTSSLKEI